MTTERHLLFAVLAFESELIDLVQLTAACRAWAADKSKPLAELLVARGWLTARDCEFVESLVERKLAKHQSDPRVTLNSVVRGDVCDAIKEVDDSDIQQSLSSWPSSGPVLIETIGETQIEPGQPKSRYTWISEVGHGGLGPVWLTADVKRSLAHQQVSVYRTGAWEHLRQWRRRNLVVASLSLFLAMSLLTGSGVSTLFGLAAKREAGRANREEKLANFVKYFYFSESQRFRL